MSIAFTISDWLGWCGASGQPPLLESPNLIVSDKPDVASIPPMVRRKLNTLGRACVSLILKLAPENSDIPIVYCSQHGDIERTMHVLHEITDGEPVSPMHFSLAVHNAICGVLSIQTGNMASISALSAGQQGLVPVLLEALGIIESGEKQVICVICDMTIPEFYQDSNAQPDEPYAVAFMLSSEEGVALELHQAALDVHDESTSSTSLGAIDLIDFLESDRNLHKISHNNAVWQLSKVVSR